MVLTNKTNGVVDMRHQTFEGLPEESFATLPTTGETVKIKRGESGYYQLPDAYMTADQLNDIYDVTKTQAQAMFYGSMFGWNAPAANPAVYDEHGEIDMEKVEQMNANKG